jgi:hypothetical protein
MLTFKGDTILENSNKIIISGYDFFYTDFPPSVINNLTGTNCICIASCFNYHPDGSQWINYTHIVFYKDISEFFKSDSSNWMGINSFYFKSVDNEKESVLIIKKMKQNNPNSLIN